MSQQTVTINVANKSLKIACPIGEESSLLAAAQDLTTRFSKVNEKNHASSSDDQAMIITALNLSYDLLKSEKAYVDDAKVEIIYMKNVDAKFYFKDNTTLFIVSDSGVYNNKTLDMKFEKNVEAKYLDSELFAEKAEYSNSKSFLSIYENVRINDIKGNLIADKLLFDITSQKLDITSFKDKKINANVNLNEKRF